MKFNLMFQQIARKFTEKYFELSKAANLISRCLKSNFKCDFFPSPSISITARFGFVGMGKKTKAEARCKKND